MPYDLGLKHGMVIDGTGFSRSRANLGSTDGTSVDISHIRGAAATTIT